MSENNISSKLIRVLLCELIEGKFSKQEILPKEGELAQCLKVSRTALRDILKILEQ